MPVAQLDATPGDVAHGVSRRRRSAACQVACAASRLAMMEPARCMVSAWPVTAVTKASRLTASSRASVVAVTLAVRRTSRSSAISPNPSPRPSVAGRRPSLVTSTM
jgi:hypothetical protein